MKLGSLTVIVMKDEVSPQNPTTIVLVHPINTIGHLMGHAFMTYQVHHIKYAISDRGRLTRPKV
jgi:hypothetical protein